MTYEDNFDTLDTSFWNVIHNCSTYNNCLHNEETQVYLRDQVGVSNGLLYITATNDPFVVAESETGSTTRAFRSGKIEAASFAQAYGKFEARIRLPQGQANGLWPAFWMMPREAICWPMGGEIDVMEWVGKDPDRIFGTSDDDS